MIDTVKTRFPYLLLAVILSALVAFADVWAYRAYRNDLIEEEERQLLLMAETVGASLQNYLLSETEKIGLYFSFPDNPRTLAERYLDLYPSLYTGAAVLDSGGEAVFSTFSDIPDTAREALSGTAAGAEIVGKRLAASGWYELLICGAIPPERGGGRVLLALDLHEVYEKIIAPIRIGEGGYSVVKDRDLAIIMHHAQSQIGMEAVYDRSQRYPNLNLKSLAAWLERQTREESGYDVINTYVWDDPNLRPIRRIVAYTVIPIQRERWIVNSTLPIEELSAPLRKMVTAMSCLTFLYLLTITAIAVLLTRLLSREKAQKREIAYLEEISRGMELAARQSEAIRHYQRVQSLGLMASHIAHEFNNYLTPVSIYAEMMESDEDVTDEQRFMLKEMLRSIEKASRLSRDLLQFSRQDSGAALKRIDLAEDTRDALSIVRQLTPKAVTLSADVTEEPLPVLGREGIMQHILMNLCKNAFHAMEHTERKEMTITLRRSADGKSGELRVRDTGCGIPEDARERIFEPFYTTKGSRHGTGLGLSVIQNIMTSLKGSIAIENGVDGGTEFVLSFPLETESATRKPPVRKIVAVDEERNLPAMREALAQYPRYRVEACRHPATALAELQKNVGWCDMILAGYSLPSMNGVEFLQIARRINPEIRLVLVAERRDPDLEWYQNNAMIDAILERDNLERELPALLEDFTSAK